jgi:UDP-glucose 4-epimerase
MKVLVTGGGGFIGSSVARCLLSNGVDVRIMDIMGSDIDGVEKIKGSILDQNVVSEAVRGCDVVIHLAAMLGVRKTEIERLDCLNINIVGTANVLDACVKDGIKRIVFSSSSEIYGEPDISPIKEESEKKPKSVYALTKLISEEYLAAYYKRYGLDYSIIRFFNVYGIGQVAEFVLPRFVKAVLEGNSPVVYGSGDQIRSFCYMDDAAKGVYLALTNDEAKGEVFNIGNDEEISMTDLAKKVIEISGKDTKIKHVDMAESDRSIGRDILFRRPDISKARELLGYSPQVCLDEGIRTLIEHGSIPDSWYEPMNYTKHGY